MTRLRVGYLAVHDPCDRWSWSGTHFYMLRALQAQGLDVVPIGRALTRQPSRVRRWCERAGWRRRPSIGGGSPLAQSRQWASALADEARQAACDVFFAPVASAILAHLDLARAAIYLSDATFRGLRGYYPDVTALPTETAAELDLIEQRAIARAARVIYPSHWAAASAVADYGADPRRVRVIAFGANVDDVPRATEVIRRRRDTTCRLLFIGRDWARKGGAVALEAVRALNARGIRAELVLCGAIPPDGVLPPGVTDAGHLDKKRPRDRAVLRRLLEQSHFLILPTRADCYSMVSCEANAFAMPAVVTATGGLPSLIEEGRNGCLIDPAAGGDAFADRIADAYASDERYVELSRATRAVYDARLNWSAWGRAMAAEFAGVV